MSSTQFTLEKAGHQTQESEFFKPMPQGYVPGRHKYVVVFGTVMSGLGKGIFASSLAKLLKDKGLKVAPIKMEGYLNIDSGTLSPYRHGEVFVLSDGLETDMDLGTYERLLDQDLARENYATSGQIFRRVLDKERSGGYLGRDVQMIPHVTGEVKYLLRDLAVKQNADVVFIEVGGTVGDHENAFYIEALRELAFEEGPQNVCFAALTYIIEPPTLGEQKTKAAQLGLKKLLEAGVQPHLIATRSQQPLEKGSAEKIAMFSNVPPNRVFSMHDRASIYTVPSAMHEDGLDKAVIEILGLESKIDLAQEAANAKEWHRFETMVTATRTHTCRIGIAGKYASLRDAYASIDKALEHCGAHLSCRIEADWIDVTDIAPADTAAALKDYHAIIVPGGFGQRGTETKIAAVKHCREHKVPYFGICLGFQMAVIEYARHVCGISDAASTEFLPHAANPVIDILPEQKKIEGLGGNMRLGGKDVLVKANSLLARLYGLPPEGGIIRERFRHRYEVDPRFIETLESHGLVFSGRHPQQPIMQMLELPRAVHPYFVGGQFHPELLSRPLRPHPMFMGLVAAAIKQAEGEVKDEAVLKWIR